jgi:large subunit ribosomal protein L13
MKTVFPKAKYHTPKWFIIDATDKILGRLSTEVSNLLRGKETSFYSPGIDQGNFVVIINSKKILVSGKKENNKFYIRNSQRPGSLKSESFKDLKNRIPSRILEKAIRRMLPGGILGRTYYKRLYIYENSSVKYIKKKSILSATINLDNLHDNNWIIKK